MATIGELLVEIRATKEQFDKSLKESGNSLYKFADTAEKVGQKMSSIGLKMSIGITAPLALIAKKSLDAAMAAVESENLFEVSMGDMADSARKWSNEISKSLGLNEYAVRQTVGTFNVMFDSMGIGKEKALDMSEGLTSLAYDMASFYNMNPEDAFQKLQAGITGEIEPLKRLGIVINETTVQAYAYEHGIGTLGTALTEQEKIQARYALIMDQTSKAQGDLARTIDSPTNKLRIFKEQVTQASIELGNALIPMFSKALDIVEPFIEKFKNLNDEQKLNIVKWGLIAAAAGPALMILGKGIETVSSLAKAYQVLNTASATFILSSVKITSIFTGLASGLAIFAAQTPAIGAFIEDMGLFKNATGELDQVANNMKGVILKNQFSGTEAANQAQQSARNIQTIVGSLKEATPELITKILELNTAYNNGSITLGEFNDKLYDLTQTMETSATLEAKRKFFIDPVTESMKAQGATTAEITAALQGETAAIDDLIASIYQLYNLNQSVTEATWSYDDSLKALDEVMKNANSTEREKQAAIFASQDALENLQIAMLKEYQDTETSIERKKELANQYITTGLQAVASGALSETAFISMAATFGVKASDIIAKADEIDIQFAGNIKSANEFQQALDNIHDKDITITTYYRSIGLAMEAASNAASKRASGGYARETNFVKDLGVVEINGEAFLPKELTNAIKTMRSDFSGIMPTKSLSGTSQTGQVVNQYITINKEIDESSIGKIIAKNLNW